MKLFRYARPARSPRAPRYEKFPDFQVALLAAGLGSVIAPVRPTLKQRYPLIPIEEYVAWRREDGAHFDPWIRLHERVGGEIIAPAPASMVIRAPVADWEGWTECGSRPTASTSSRKHSRRSSSKLGSAPTSSRTFGSGIR